MAIVNIPIIAIAWKEPCQCQTLRMALASDGASTGATPDITMSSEKNFVRSFPSKRSFTIARPITTPAHPLNAWKKRTTHNDSIFMTSVAIN